MRQKGLRISGGPFFMPGSGPRRCARRRSGVRSGWRTCDRCVPATRGARSAARSGCTRGGGHGQALIPACERGGRGRRAGTRARSSPGPSAPLHLTPPQLIRRRSAPTEQFAEGVGFEPTMGYEPIAVFKTAALGHYASPPVSAEVYPRPAHPSESSCSGGWQVASAVSWTHIASSTCGMTMLSGRPSMT